MDDMLWQGWWHDLAVMPSFRYNAPSGKFGRRFVRDLNADLCGFAGQTVEHGVVHCLPYSDTSTIPPCHHIPRNTEADQEEAQHMGF